MEANIQRMSQLRAVNCLSAPFKLIILSIQNENSNIVKIIIKQVFFNESTPIRTFVIR